MARQTVEIVAVDKTARALGNIDGRLKGLGRSTQNLERGFGSLQSKIIAVGGVLATAFGARNILRTAADVENLGVRFQFLFGSVEEGNKAFETMLDFASKVPFTLQEIQAGAGNLAVVSENAEELSKNLQIVGNVAAVSGLDFRTASEQIQRSFSGGIAAAEIFRERGIRALLGFQNGAKVTAEETVKKFEEVFGPGGRFENATLALANTYDGVLSMIQDKIFKFTLALGNQGGLLEFAKGILGTLDNILQQQFGSIEDFAATAGQKIIDVVQQAVIGVARIADIVKPAFQLVADGINGLIKFVNALPPMIRDFGIIGFFLLGPKFKLITVLVAALFEEILMAIGFVVKGVETIANKGVEGINILISGINKLRDVVGKDPIPLLEKFTFGEESPEAFANKVKGSLGEIMEGFTGAEQEAGKLETVVLKFFDAVDLTIEQQKKLKEEISKTIEASKPQVTEQDKVNNSVKEIIANIQKQKEQIQGLTVDQKVAVELEKLKLDEMLAQVKASTEIKNAKRAEIEELVRANILLQERKQLEGELRSISGALGPGMLDEFDPEKERLNKALETLQTAKDQKIIAEEEYLKAREALYRQYDKKREEQQKQQVQKTLENIKNGTVQTQEIEDLGAKGRLELAKGLGTDLLNNLAKVNEKAFRIAKAAAIANAIVSTAQGVANALKTLPIPLNFLAAAAVAAQGYAQVAAIRSTSYTGPREKGGPVSAGQSYLVGEKGPEMFVPNAGGQIVSNNGMMGQPVTVNFNITTTDARGFDELLVERRGTIVSIINQAMNVRGKTGVVG